MDTSYHLPMKMEQIECSLFHLHRHFITPAYEDGTDRVFRNVGIYNSEAGELTKRKHNIFRTQRKFQIKNIISSIRINHMTTRSRWKFRICKTTNDLILNKFSHYVLLWPGDGPQWPKHVVSLINRIQRQLYLPHHNIFPSFQYTGIC